MRAFSLLHSITAESDRRRSARSEAQIFQLRQQVASTATRLAPATMTPAARGVPEWGRSLPSDDAVDDCERRWEQCVEGRDESGGKNPVNAPFSPPSAAKSLREAAQVCTEASYSATCPVESANIRTAARQYSREDAEGSEGHLVRALTRVAMLLYLIRRKP